ncbi:hypothetical protein QBC35DRAFT_502776 [Podospora australis]|uniref:C2H2-type domain-containing protein n=1 Tax=Podospora australis TaxID=1536484 RepID=A0AAN6WQF1_9PEZI|nr:hypothetical protein QBC35DRAFT_502776 [Podospora australis]
MDPHTAANRNEPNPLAPEDLQLFRSVARVISLLRHEDGGNNNNHNNTYMTPSPSIRRQERAGKDGDYFYMDEDGHDDEGDEDDNSNEDDEDEEDDEDDEDDESDSYSDEREEESEDDDDSSGSGDTFYYYHDPAPSQQDFNSPQLHNATSPFPSFQQQPHQLHPLQASAEATAQGSESSNVNTENTGPNSLDSNMMFGSDNTQQQGQLQGPSEADRQAEDSLRCWDHGCNGRKFTTASNLRRHRKEKGQERPECPCPRCGAVFSRTTARNTHMERGSCNRIRRYSNGRARPNRGGGKQNEG